MISNIKIIDFNILFRDKIQKDIVDSFYIYKMFNNDGKINLSNKETKQIIENFVIYRVSECIHGFQLEKKVVCIQPWMIEESLEIFKYCDGVRLKKLLLKTLKMLSKKHTTRVSLFNLSTDLESQDTLAMLFNKCNG